MQWGMEVKQTLIYSQFIDSLNENQACGLTYERQRKKALKSYFLQLFYLFKKSNWVFKTLGFTFL